jgi:hypothetical protein
MYNDSAITDVGEWIKDHKHLVPINPELAKIAGAGAVTSVKPSKHRNIRTKDLDGETYDSGIEAADAANFVRAVNGGQYLLYKHHLTVKLPGGIRMQLDHFLINNKLQIEVYDSKAWDEKTGSYLITPDWRNKQKLFQETYGIEIKII